MRTVRSIRERLKLNPDDPKLRWQHGCCLAFAGDWEGAWHELEWRFRGHKLSMQKRQVYPKPDWDGSRTRLLIYQDQGFGDLFQYVRYVHEVHCPYVLEVEPEALTLMRHQNFNVVCRGQPLPEYDQVVAACSLPNHFRKFSAHRAYLTAPPKSQFLLGGGKRKVGVAWAGNPGHYGDGHRSCSPDEFMGLVDCGELVSLMVKKVDLPFADFSLKIRDWADTAEIIGQLDCVVTVDTAVGHLAAALGKDVYLLLSYEHDWRWMSGRPDTPWYPTVHLMRQPKKGDWKSVFQQIKTVLS